MAHVGQLLAHPNLLLEPVSVPQPKNVDHQLNLPVQLDLLELSEDVSLFLAPNLGIVQRAPDGSLVAGQIELLGVAVENLLPIRVSTKRNLHHRLSRDLVDLLVLLNDWREVVSLDFDRFRRLLCLRSLVQIRVGLGRLITNESALAIRGLNVQRLGIVSPVLGDGRLFSGYRRGSLLVLLLLVVRLTAGAH